MPWRQQGSSAFWAALPRLGHRLALNSGGAWNPKGFVGLRREYPAAEKVLPARLCRSSRGSGIRGRLGPSQCRSQCGLLELCLKNILSSSSYIHVPINLMDVHRWSNRLIPVQSVATRWNLLTSLIANPLWERSLLKFPRASANPLPVAAVVARTPGQKSMLNCI